ncbi:glycosyltransferase [Aureitalea sp. L0-47]|uniref:glycosyltransferase n=1 Tax=Aureitalea sp. L0-47 TaxID=2816962 RepID=UPI002238567F|nr:glycosyltransferase [Aureitalea sp. L0-47]MCW5519165.1 glycosyltransferase [Aureitalea sp. L0-47]
MKVLQLIDSLDPGGAEKMAVTLANSLVGEVEASLLCATRKEGLLKEMLNRNVGYYFANKSGSLDIVGLMRLRKFVKKNDIDVIHAHSSSFFWATLLKFTLPKLRIVWHDHYGGSEQLAMRKHRSLGFCSRYFSVIIAVNTKLQAWAKQNLHCKRVEYLKNFVSPYTSKTSIDLSGDPSQRIVCLANLRPQKDHINLFKAFEIVQESFPMATLHCLGKKVNAKYSTSLEAYLEENDLKGVFMLGSQKDIHHLLEQASIGVLSSESEGLPLALLEYGMAGLPVICTDVGQCKEVVGDFGQVVPSGDPEALAKVLTMYLVEKDKARADAVQFSEHIKANYSFKAILPQLMNIYNG